MAKTLAIDYGEKRIGLALSDADNRIAFAHSIIINDQKVFDTCEELIRSQSVTRIVLGYPLGSEGNTTEFAKKVSQFKDDLDAWLKKHSLIVKIDMWNETLTSREAYDNLLQKGYTHEKVKQHLDAEAARIILQEYLDHQPTS